MSSPYADAISGIESGGRYGIVGPTHPKYGRALGKYQVMEANLPEWSRAALGREITADEFLNSPRAQDEIFNHRFGQYVQRHGPEGAARAWFAGEGGMNDPNRRDVLGTSVADYARKFNAALGGQGGAPMSPAGQGTPPAGILGNGMGEAPAGLLGMLSGQSGGNPMMQLSGGLLGAGQPQAKAPDPPMPQMMARRPVDLSALAALANLPGFGRQFS